MVIGEGKGVCRSSTGGLLYSCEAVPFKYPDTGRYASSPSDQVIYITAGQWPKKSATDRDFALSHSVRLESSASGVRTRFVNASHEATSPNATSKYTAELWKSADGGKTWKSLLSDEGAFYFNDISCFDNEHCVAVGEGFAEDGSTSPGARVYMTEDGKTFKVVHTELSDGASLMAAKMLSLSEIWVGGATKVGGLLAPALALHSTDAGKTWTNEGSTIIGQMITNMDFLSPTHGYATSVSALQVSALLEFS